MIAESRAWISRNPTHPEACLTRASLSRLGLVLSDAESQVNRIAYTIRDRKTDPSEHVSCSYGKSLRQITILVDRYQKRILGTLGAGLRNIKLGLVDRPGAEIETLRETYNELRAIAGQQETQIREHIRANWPQLVTSVTTAQPVTQPMLNVTVQQEFSEAVPYREAEAVQVSGDTLAAGDQIVISPRRQTSQVHAPDTRPTHQPAEAPDACVGPSATQRSQSPQIPYLPKENLLDGNIRMVKAATANLKEQIKYEKRQSARARSKRSK